MAMMVEIAVRRAGADEDSGGPHFGRHYHIVWTGHPLRVLF